MVDATSRKNRQMDAAQIAAISEIQSANSIASDRLLLVVFALINIRAACATSTVEHMGRPDMIKNFFDLLAVLHAD